MKKQFCIFLLLMVLIAVYICCMDQTANQKLDAFRKAGHYLFFDKRLSYNNTKSCASCHEPLMAFTDGYHRSLGANGDVHKRNAPTLLNISSSHFFTFADSSIHTIYEQVALPLFNTRFTELGAGGNKDGILSKLRADSVYKALFSLSGAKAFDWDFIRRSLEAYCMGLNSYGSKYDEVQKGKIVFTEDEQKGKELFFSEALRCGHCHGGADLNTPQQGTGIYVNNGFFEPDSSHVNRKFAPDMGLYEITHDAKDIGKYKIPTLRNIILTAPYMHDGSVNTLDSVISFYAKGGNHHPAKDTLISGFVLSAIQQQQLLSFLKTLTDTSYLGNGYFRDPFGMEQMKN